MFTPFLKRALLAAPLVLCACTSTSSLELLDSASPSGSPFTQSLFKNYAILARSFGVGGNHDSNSDFELGLFGGSGDIQNLAEAFATKALIAAKGAEVDPEPSFDDESARARDRLVRDLAATKDRYPNNAARAQADFDCWMLNLNVDTQHGAAAQCRTAFDAAAVALETGQSR